MSEQRQRFVAEVEDAPIGQVIRELSTATGLPYERYRGQWVLHCLQMFYYPNGAGEKPIAVAKKDLDAVDPEDRFLLRRKIGKIENDDLYALLRELGGSKYQIEDFHGTSILEFFKKTLIRRDSRAKPYRWNSR